MKIELNGIYKTRSGKKCRIICVDIKSNTQGLSFPVLGLVDMGDHECTVALTLDGTGYIHRESDHDLIAEWQEPKPRRLAWISVLGEIRYSEVCPATCYTNVCEQTSSSGGVSIKAIGWSRATWLPDEPEEGGS